MNGSGTHHTTPDELRKTAKTNKEREKFDALPNWKRKAAAVYGIKHDEWKTEEDFDKIRTKRAEERKAEADKKKAEDEKKTEAAKPTEPVKTETAVKVEATVTPQPVRVDVNPAAPHVPIIMIQPPMPVAPVAAVSSVTEADESSGTSDPSPWYGVASKAVMWVQAAVCGAALWALFGNKIINAIGGL